MEMQRKFIANQTEFHRTSKHTENQDEITLKSTGEAQEKSIGKLMGFIKGNPRNSINFMMDFQGDPKEIHWISKYSLNSKNS